MYYWLNLGLSLVLIAPYACLPLKAQESPLADLDLGSTSRNIISSHEAPVTVDFNGGSRTVEPGGMVTAAEHMAIQQILSTGQQSLLLSELGSAVGGVVNLNLLDNQALSNLVVPQGVTAVRDFAASATFNVLGSLTNAGSIYALSSDSAVTNAIINANNIVNQQGALLSSSLPGGTVDLSTVLAGLTNVVSNLNLTLNALQNITNAGMITSSGSLTAQAGASIVNALPTGVTGLAPVMQALNNVNMAAANIVNQGSILAQLGNINLSTQSLVNQGVLAAQLGNINASLASVVNSGTMQALGMQIQNSLGNTLAINNTAGLINASNEILLSTLGSTKDLAGNVLSRAALSISGGTMAASKIDLASPGGRINLQMDEVNGALSFVGSDLYTSVSRGTLSIAAIEMTGDPVIVNSGGSIDLSNFVGNPSNTVTGNTGAGNITGSGPLFQFNDNFIAIASGDIFASSAPVNATIDVTGAPGSRITLIAGVTNTSECVGAGCTASTTGGKISLAGVNLSTSGGPISLQSFSGTGSGGVQIGNLSTQGTGAAGNISILSNGAVSVGAFTGPGNSFVPGSIQAAGTSGAAGGAVSITSTGGLAGDANNGKIFTGGITTSGGPGGAVTITTAGTTGASAIISVGGNLTTSAGAGTGGAVSLTSASVSVLGNLITSGGSGVNGGAGGAIQLNSTATTNGVFVQGNINTAGGAGSIGIGGAGGNLQITSSGTFTQIGEVVSGQLNGGNINISGGNGFTGGVGGGATILTTNGNVLIGGSLNSASGTSSSGIGPVNNSITIIASGSVSGLQAVTASIDASNPNGVGGAINIIAGTSNTAVCNPCTASATGGGISFGGSQANNTSGFSLVTTAAPIRLQSYLGTGAGGATKQPGLVSVNNITTSGVGSFAAKDAGALTIFANGGIFTGAISAIGGTIGNGGAVTITSTGGLPNPARDSNGNFVATTPGVTDPNNLGVIISGALDTHGGIGGAGGAIQISTVGSNATSPVIQVTANVTTTGGNNVTGVGGAGGNLQMTSAGSIQIGSVVSNQLVGGTINISGGNGTTGGVGGGATILATGGGIFIGGTFSGLAGTSSGGTTITNNDITLIASGNIATLVPTSATIDVGNPNGVGGAINIIAGTTNTSVCTLCTESATGGGIYLQGISLSTTAAAIQLRSYSGTGAGGVTKQPGLVSVHNVITAGAGSGSAKNGGAVTIFANGGIFTNTIATFGGVTGAGGGVQITSTGGSVPSPFLNGSGTYITPAPAGTDPNNGLIIISGIINTFGGDSNSQVSGPGGAGGAVVISTTGSNATLTAIQVVGRITTYGGDSSGSAGGAGGALALTGAQSISLTSSDGIDTRGGDGSTGGAGGGINIVSTGTGTNNGVLVQGDIRTTGGQGSVGASGFGSAIGAGGAGGNLQITSAGAYTQIGNVANNVLNGGTINVAGGDGTTGGVGGGATIKTTKGSILFGGSINSAAGASGTTTTNNDITLIASSYIATLLPVSATIDASNTGGIGGAINIIAGTSNTSVCNPCTASATGGGIFLGPVKDSNTSGINLTTNSAPVFLGSYAGTGAGGAGVKPGLIAINNISSPGINTGSAKNGGAVTMIAEGGIFTNAIGTFGSFNGAGGEISIISTAGLPTPPPTSTLASSFIVEQHRGFIDGFSSSFATVAPAPTDKNNGLIIIGGAINSYGGSSSAPLFSGPGGDGGRVTIRTDGSSATTPFINIAGNITTSGGNTLGSSGGAGGALTISGASSVYLLGTLITAGGFGSNGGAGGALSISSTGTGENDGVIIRGNLNTTGGTGNFNGTGNGGNGGAIIISSLGSYVQIGNLLGYSDALAGTVAGEKLRGTNNRILSGGNIFATGGNGDAGGVGGGVTILTPNGYIALGRTVNSAAGTSSSGATTINRDVTFIAGRDIFQLTPEDASIVDDSSPNNVIDTSNPNGLGGSINLIAGVTNITVCNPCTANATGGGIFLSGSQTTSGLILTSGFNLTTTGAPVLLVSRSGTGAGGVTAKAGIVAVKDINASGGNTNLSKHAGLVTAFANGGIFTGNITASASFAAGNGGAVNLTSTGGLVSSVDTNNGKVFVGAITTSGGVGGSGGAVQILTTGSAGSSPVILVGSSSGTTPSAISTFGGTISGAAGGAGGSVVLTSASISVLGHIITLGGSGTSGGAGGGIQLTSTGTQATNGISVQGNIDSTGGTGSSGVGGAGGRLDITSNGSFIQIGNVVNNTVVGGDITVSGGNGTVGGVGGGVTIRATNTSTAGASIYFAGPINAAAGISNNGTTTTNNGITLIASSSISVLKSTAGTITAANPNGLGGAINIISGTNSTSVCNPCGASSTGSGIFLGGGQSGISLVTTGAPIKLLAYGASKPAFINTANLTTSGSSASGNAGDITLFANSGIFVGAIAASGANTGGTGGMVEITSTAGLGTSLDENNGVIVVTSITTQGGAGSNGGAVMISTSGSANNSAIIQVGTASSSSSFAPIAIATSGGSTSGAPGGSGGSVTLTSSSLFISGSIDSTGGNGAPGGAGGDITVNATGTGSDDAVFVLGNLLAKGGSGGTTNNGGGGGHIEVGCQGGGCIQIGFMNSAGNIIGGNVNASGGSGQTSGAGGGIDITCATGTPVILGTLISSGSSGSFFANPNGDFDLTVNGGIFAGGSTFDTNGQPFVVMASGSIYASSAPSGAEIVTDGANIVLIAGTSSFDNNGNPILCTNCPVSSTGGDVYLPDVNLNLCCNSGNAGDLQIEAHGPAIGVFGNVTIGTVSGDSAIYRTASAASIDIKADKDITVLNTIAVCCGGSGLSPVTLTAGRDIFFPAWLSMCCNEGTVGRVAFTAARDISLNNGTIQVGYFNVGGTIEMRANRNISMNGGSYFTTGVASITMTAFGGNITGGGGANFGIFNNGFTNPSPFNTVITFNTPGTFSGITVSGNATTTCNCGSGSIQSGSGGSGGGGSSSGSGNNGFPSGFGSSGSGFGSTFGSGFGGNFGSFGNNFGAFGSGFPSQQILDPLNQLFFPGLILVGGAAPPAPPTSASSPRPPTITPPESALFALINNQFINGQSIADPFNLAGTPALNPFTTIPSLSSGNQALLQASTGNLLSTNILVGDPTTHHGSLQSIVLGMQATGLSTDALSNWFSFTSGSTMRGSNPFIDALSHGGWSLGYDAKLNELSFTGMLGVDPVFFQQMQQQIAVQRQEAHEAGRYSHTITGRMDDGGWGSHYQNLGPSGGFTTAYTMYGGSEVARTNEGFVDWNAQQQSGESFRNTGSFGSFNMTDNSGSLGSLTNVANAPAANSSAPTANKQIDLTDTRAIRETSVEIDKRAGVERTKILDRDGLQHVQVRDLNTGELIKSFTVDARPDGNHITGQVMTQDQNYSYSGIETPDGSQSLTFNYADGHREVGTRTPTPDGARTVHQIFDSNLEKPTRITDTTQTANGLDIKTQDFKFDAKGNPISLTEKNTSTNNDFSRTNSVQVDFKYDANGNPIKLAETRTHSDANGTFTDFKSTDGVHRTTRTGPDGTTLVSTISTISIDANGDTREEGIIFNLDDKGSFKGQDFVTHTSASGKGQVTKYFDTEDGHLTQFVTSESGKVTSATSYLTDEKTGAHSTITYGSDGQVLSQQQFNDGKTSSTKTGHYQPGIAYDNNGNSYATSVWVEGPESNSGQKVEDPGFLFSGSKLYTMATGKPFVEKNANGTITTTYLDGSKTVDNPTNHTHTYINENGSAVVNSKGDTRYFDTSGKFIGAQLSPETQQSLKADSRAISAAVNALHNNASGGDTNYEVLGNLLDRVNAGEITKVEAISGYVKETGLKVSEAKLDAALGLVKGKDYDAAALAGHKTDYAGLQKVMDYVPPVETAPKNVMSAWSNMLMKNDPNLSEAQAQALTQHSFEGLVGRQVTVDFNGDRKTVTITPELMEHAAQGNLFARTAIGASVHLDSQAANATGITDQARMGVRNASTPGGLLGQSNYNYSDPLASAPLPSDADKFDGLVKHAPELLTFGGGVGSRQAIQGEKIQNAERSINHDVAQTNHLVMTTIEKGGVTAAATIATAGAGSLVAPALSGLSPVVANAIVGTSGFVASKAANNLTNDVANYIAPGSAPLTTGLLGLEYTQAPTSAFTMNNVPTAGIPVTDAAGNTHVLHGQQALNYMNANENIRVSNINDHQMNVQNFGDLVGAGLNFAPSFSTTMLSNSSRGTQQIAGVVAGTGGGQLAGAATNLAGSFIHDAAKAHGASQQFLDNVNIIKDYASAGLSQVGGWAASNVTNVPQPATTPTTSVTHGPEATASRGPAPSVFSGPEATASRGPAPSVFSGPEATASRGPAPSVFSGPEATASRGPAPSVFSGPEASGAPSHPAGAPQALASRSDLATAPGLVPVPESKALAPAPSATGLMPTTSPSTQHPTVGPASPETGVLTAGGLSLTVGGEAIKTPGTIEGVAQNVKQLPNEAGMVSVTHNQDGSVSTIVKVTSDQPIAIGGQQLVGDGSTFSKQVLPDGTTVKVSPDGKTAIITTPVPEVSTPTPQGAIAGATSTSGPRADTVPSTSVEAAAPKIDAAAPVSVEAVGPNPIEPAAPAAPVEITPAMQAYAQRIGATIDPDGLIITSGGKTLDRAASDKILARAPVLAEVEAVQGAGGQVYNAGQGDKFQSAWQVAREGFGANINLNGESVLGAVEHAPQAAATPHVDNTTGQTPQMAEHVNQPVDVSHVPTAVSPGKTDLQIQTELILQQQGMKQGSPDNSAVKQGGNLQPPELGAPAPQPISGEPPLDGGGSRDNAQQSWRDGLQQNLNEIMSNIKAASAPAVPAAPTGDTAIGTSVQAGAPSIDTAAPGSVKAPGSAGPARVAEAAQPASRPASAGHAFDHQSGLAGENYISLDPENRSNVSPSSSAVAVASPVKLETPISTSSLEPAAGGSNAAAPAPEAPLLAKASDVPRVGAAEPAGNPLVEALNGHPDAPVDLNVQAGSVVGEGAFNTAHRTTYTTNDGTDIPVIAKVPKEGGLYMEALAKAETPEQRAAVIQNFDGQQAVQAHVEAGVVKENQVAAIDRLGGTDTIHGAVVGKVNGEPAVIEMDKGTTLTDLINQRYQPQSDKPNPTMADKAQAVFAQDPKLESMVKDAVANNLQVFGNTDGAKFDGYAVQLNPDGTPAAVNSLDHQMAVTTHDNITWATGKPAAAREPEMAPLLRDWAGTDLSSAQTQKMQAISNGLNDPAGVASLQQSGMTGEQIAATNSRVQAALPHDGGNAQFPNLDPVSTPLSSGQPAVVETPSPLSEVGGSSSTPVAHTSEPQLGAVGETSNTAISVDVPVAVAGEGPAIASQSEVKTPAGGSVEVVSAGQPEVDLGNSGTPLERNVGESAGSGDNVSIASKNPGLYLGLEPDPRVAELQRPLLGEGEVKLNGNTASGGVNKGVLKTHFGEFDGKQVAIQFDREIPPGATIELKQTDSPPVPRTAEGTQLEIRVHKEQKVAVVSMLLGEEAPVVSVLREAVVKVDGQPDQVVVIRMQEHGGETIKSYVERKYESMSDTEKAQALANIQAKFDDPTAQAKFNEVHTAAAQTAFDKAQASGADVMQLVKPEDMAMRKFESPAAGPDGEVTWAQKALMVMEGDAQLSSAVKQTLADSYVLGDADPNAGNILVKEGANGQIKLTRIDVDHALTLNSEHQTADRTGLGGGEGVVSPTDWNGVRDLFASQGPMSPGELQHYADVASYINSPEGLTELQQAGLTPKEIDAVYVRATNMVENKGFPLHTGIQMVPSTVPVGPAQHFAETGKLLPIPSSVHPLYDVPAKAIAFNSNSGNVSAPLVVQSASLSITYLSFDPFASFESPLSESLLTQFPWISVSLAADLFVNSRTRVVTRQYEPVVDFTSPVQESLITQFPWLSTAVAMDAYAVSQARQDTEAGRMPVGERLAAQPTLGALPGAGKKPALQTSSALSGALPVAAEATTNVSMSINRISDEELKRNLDSIRRHEPLVDFTAPIHECLSKQFPWDSTTIAALSLKTPVVRTEVTQQLAAPWGSQAAVMSPYRPLVDFSAPLSESPNRQFPWDSVGAAMDAYVINQDSATLITFGNTTVTASQSVVTGRSFNPLLDFDLPVAVAVYTQFPWISVALATREFADTLPPKEPEAIQTAQDTTVDSGRSASSKAHPAKPYVMRSGNVLIAPTESTQVVTSQAVIEVAARAHVFIMSTDTQVCLFNLNDQHHGAVKVIVGGDFLSPEVDKKLVAAEKRQPDRHDIKLGGDGKTITVAPGHFVLFSSQPEADFTKANPAAPIAYRSIKRVSDKRGTLFWGEFSVLTAMSSVTGLRDLKNARDAASRRMLRDLVKTVAVLSHMQASGGQFKTTAVPTASTSSAPVILVAEQIVLPGSK